MSKTQISLCSLLLKEHFGEIVQKVGTYLMQQGPCFLRKIASDITLPLDKVKSSLCVLIHHHLGDFELNKRGFVEYAVKCDMIFLLLYFPRYIYCAKILYGDAAELLVEEILNNGRMTMSCVIKKVIDRLREATGSDYGSEEVAAVKDKFINLVQTRFLERCPAPESEENDVSLVVPSMSVSKKELYAVPEIKLYLLAQKSDDEDDEPVSKKRKIETEDYPDKGIYWKVNTDRFHQYFRDQAIISAVSTSIDKKASEIVRTILRLSETRTDPWAPTTNAVAVHEIVDLLSKETNIEKEDIPPYLTVLTEDSHNFISKAEERSGGMYVVNTRKVLQKLAEATAISVVQDRFGSKCCRIFRLLLVKKYLEQKQIEDLAMIPAKDTKEYTYKMLVENFILAHEIPRTPDHAASRTFFLFHVDMNQVCRMLIERCYKAIFNAISCREWQTKEHKRLLEKKQRVDAIVTTLQQSGAESSQVQEVEEMITPPEHAQLDKVKHVTDKLEASEMQLAEMLFILKTWLSSLSS